MRTYDWIERGSQVCFLGMGLRDCSNLQHCNKSNLQDQIQEALKEEEDGGGNSDSSNSSSDSESSSSSSFGFLTLLQHFPLTLSLSLQYNGTHGTNGPRYTVSVYGIRYTGTPVFP